MRMILLVAAAAAAVACGDSVCVEAATVKASCLSSSAPPADEIECGDFAACNADCVLEFSADYCDIQRDTAETKIVSAYNDCVAACSGIGTGDPKKSSE